MCSPESSSPFRQLSPAQRCLVIAQPERGECSALRPKPEFSGFQFRVRLWWYLSIENRTLVPSIPPAANSSISAERCTVFDLLSAPSIDRPRRPVITPHWPRAQNSHKNLMAAAKSANILLTVAHSLAGSWTQFPRRTVQAARILDLVGQYALSSEMLSPCVLDVSIDRSN
jgi:hypothetical protein